MKDDDIKKYTEANRISWNEVTPIHQKHREVDLKEEFKKPGFSTLDEVIIGKLNKIGLDGKDVAQLCCNNGRETLSLLNLGAKSGIGFDISDDAMDEAKELAEVSGLNCEFVRADVYDLSDEYDNRFDLILITIGALYWLPDLPKFFEKVNAMLKSGGHLVVYDSHPFTNMFAFPEDPEFDKYNPTVPVFSYFRKEPWVCDDGIDYIGKTKYKGAINYGWSYNVADIINPIVKTGLRLLEFNEYMHDISSEFEHIDNNGIVPLSYLLIAQK